MCTRLPGLLGEDDEHASLLVEDPLELLVQDHLTQFLLHLNSIIRVLQRHLFKILKNDFNQAELYPLGIPLSWEARSCWPRSPPAPCCRAQ